jgi:hypothetical protein
MNLSQSGPRAAAARVRLVAVLAVLVAACGTGHTGDTGGGKPPPATAATTLSPAGVQVLTAPRDLTPGVRYLDDRFRVPYAFTPPDPGGLGGPWHAGAGGKKGEEPFSGISLDYAPGDPGISFSAPDRVYDPRQPTRLVPAPRDQQSWVAWLQAHPYLRAQKPAPVTIGGIRGIQLDSKVVKTSAPASFCAPLPACVPIHEFGTGGPGGPVGALKGDHSRLIVLEVEGRPLVITYGAQGDKQFQAFATLAKKLLASVEFRPTG